MSESDPVAVEVVELTATSEGKEPEIVVDVGLNKNDASNLECSKNDEKQRSIEPGDEEDYHSAEDEPSDQVEEVKPSSKAEGEASFQTSSSDEDDEETGSVSDSEGNEQTSEGSENKDDEDDENDENDEVSDDSKSYSSGTLSESEPESVPGSEEEVQPSQEEEVKERGSGDGQEAEKEKSADDADRKDPSFVPRHDRFWGHDDRDTDLPEIERRPQPSRKLWERTSDKWLHDMYNEEEQAPKTREELENSRREQTRRTGRRGRRYFDLKDFVDRRRQRRGRRDFEDEDRSSYRETGNREKHSESYQSKTIEDEETRQSRRGKKDAAFRGERQRRDSLEEAHETENRTQKVAGESRRNREEQGERQSHRQRTRDYNEDEEYIDRRRQGFGRKEARENQIWQGEEDEYEDRNWDNRRRPQEDASDVDLTRRRRERTSQWAEDGERDIRRARHNQDRRNEGSQRRWERDNEADEGRGKRYRRNRQDDEEHIMQQRSDNRQKAVRDGKQNEHKRTQQGSFGTDRKEGRRGKDSIQRKTEEATANDTKPAASHSWSRIRGRGRGRAQDLQQPRKRAEDFTRERELARRVEAEEQRKTQDQKNFEDATEEDADVIVEGSDEEYEKDESHQPETDKGRQLEGSAEQLLQEGASAPLSKDRNVAAGPAGQTQNKDLSQSGQKGASGSTATTGAKPKRYSSQRQRVSQQIPAVSSEPVQEQLPAVIPEGYYEQMAAGYQGMYGSPGPPSTQPPMGMVPQQQGMMVQQEMAVPQADEHSEVPSGMPMHTMGQPMAPLQHEAMMQQRLAMAYQQGIMQQERAMATANTISQQEMQPMQPQQPVAQQERPIAPSNMMQPQSIPQMQPQQQPQTGIQPGPVMSPVSQANMMVTGAPHGPSSVGFVPNMQQHMLYGNPPFPMINMGVPGQLLPPHMYGIPMQGGPFYPPPTMLPNQDSGDASHLRRRPTAAIPIKPPPE